MWPKIVTEVLGRLCENTTKFHEVDRVFLTSEQRSSPHMSACSEGNRTLRISLPRGTELEDGDVLAIRGDVAIVVAAKPEDLFVIPVNKDALEAAAIGYQLGNLHRPTRFTDSAILTPADPMVADVLSRMGVEIERKSCAFVGQRYGAITKPHSNDHHSH